MAVAVNQPRQRSQAEIDAADPMTTIIKGLQIAGSVYGIKDAHDKSKLLEQQTELEKRKVDQADQVLANNNDGVLTQKDFITQAHNYQFVPEGTPNAIPMKIRGENPGEVQMMFAVPRQKEMDPVASALRTQQLEDAMRKAADAKEKKAFEQTPDGKMSKLTGDKVKRFDEAKMGLAAVNGMAEALDNGDNTFSLVGSNDFTRNAQMFDEAIGRMQSGGAINTGEAKNFRAMAPTKWDSPDQQRAKLLQMQNEFSNRLHTLGFQPEEVGLSKPDFKYGANPNKPGSVNPSLVAGGGLKEGIGAMKNSKPQTVIQNGHTYNLNPKTGNYE